MSTINKRAIASAFKDMQEVILVVDSIPPNAGGAGFAVTSQGEDCYIPKNQVDRAKLQEGDYFSARVTPNTKDRRDQTPLRVVGLIKILDMDFVPDNQTPKVQQATLEDRIMDLMREDEHAYPHRVGELANKLTVDAGAVQLALQRMHTAGEIWEAKIERKGTQTKASYVLWALDDEWFALDYE